MRSRKTKEERWTWKEIVANLMLLAMFVSAILFVWFTIYTSTPPHQEACEEVHNIAREYVYVDDAYQDELVKFDKMDRDGKIQGILPSSEPELFNFYTWHGADITNWYHLEFDSVFDVLGEWRDKEIIDLPGHDEIPLPGFSYDDHKQIDYGELKTFDPQGIYIGGGIASTIIVGLASWNLKETHSLSKKVAVLETKVDRNTEDIKEV